MLTDTVACAAQGLLFPRTACHLYSLCAGDVYGFITKWLTFTEQLVRSRGFSLTVAGSKTLPGDSLGGRQAANAALGNPPPYSGGMEQSGYKLFSLDA